MCGCTHMLMYMFMCTAKPMLEIQLFLMVPGCFSPFFNSTIPTASLVHYSATATAAATATATMVVSILLNAALFFIGPNVNC